MNTTEHNLAVDIQKMLPLHGLFLTGCYALKNGVKIFAEVDPQLANPSNPFATYSISIRNLARPTEKSRTGTLSSPTGAKP